MTAIHLSSSAASPPTSNTRVWVGRALTAIALVFLVFDASVKLLQRPEAIEGTVALGYPASVLVPLGLLQLTLLALYLIPRTALLGAVLWTGYLGGAVATHVRVGNPIASHILFPVYVGALLWGGLWLRDRRARTMLSA